MVFLQFLLLLTQHLEKRLPHPHGNFAHPVPAANRQKIRQRISFQNFNIMNGAIHVVT